MKVFTFPYILKSEDFGDYLLDCKDQDTAQSVAKAAEDFGFDNENFNIEETDSEDLPVYDALSLTQYSSLGYSSKEELFSAYDEINDDIGTTAYSIDGAESAVIGVTEDHTRFVYDYNLLIASLMDDQTDLDSAVEWYEYNIVRSFPYFQPSPIVVHCVTL